MNSSEPRTSVKPPHALSDRRILQALRPEAELTPAAESVRLAVQSIGPGALIPANSVAPTRVHHPLSILALLVYCYLRGIYSSNEIEALLWRDDGLRELALNEIPSANMLRRFRRENRDCLHRCLAHALDFPEHGNVPPSRSRSSPSAQSADEALQRIAKAMFIDRMESERPAS